MSHLKKFEFHFTSKMIFLQIRDYRKCSFEKGGTSAIDNSPLVHRVPLHMCMENVVKDILSISNDSWTYKDILVGEVKY